MDNKEFYKCEIIIYIECEKVVKYMSLIPQLRHYAMITHDRDTNENGELKKVHSHILCTWRQRQTFKSVAKKFQVIAEYCDITILPENVDLIKSTLKASYEYLTHKNNEEKFQYSESLIISDCKTVFTTDDSNNNKGFEIVSDMLQGDLSLFEMAQKYGRDFIVNYKAYAEFCLRVRNEVKNDE